MDIELIKKKIAEDKEKNTSSYRRYPVRFLFMEMNNDTQKEIEDLVKSSEGELLDLSDYIMKKDDGWMTKSRFIHIVKKYTSQKKDTFIVGFSELIRFLSKKEIETTVLSLFDIENSNMMDPTCARRRIYIICFSMIDNIYKVIENCFARKDLLNPFINDDFEFSGEFREVCFVSSEYASNIKKNKITTSVDWIGLWRNSKLLDFTIPIWCCSESLYQWHQKASPDNAFQIDVVTNTKEYLQKAYKFTIDFPYFEDDAKYWNQLEQNYSQYGKGNTISEFISRSLKTDVNSSIALAEKLFITNNQYEKWLITSYISAYNSDSYLSRVLKTLKSNSKKEFLVSIWLQGYWTNNTRYLNERIEIIKEISKYAGSTPPEKELQEIIRDGVTRAISVDLSLTIGQNEISVFELSQKADCDEAEMRSRLLSYYTMVFRPAFTGFSSTEKEFVINLFSNDVLDLEEIKTVYPLIYMYLFGQSEKQNTKNNEWENYLQAYRESKIHNKDNDYLSQYYKKGCANSTSLYEMYYELPRQEALVQQYNQDADIYVLDGVGAEYIPLLVELFEKNGYDVDQCNYAACHLPSITEINKDYLSVISYKEWYRDFDRNVIHGEFYKTAINMRKALDTLESKVKDMIAESFGNKIVVTADHGATARARWTDSKKKYEFSNADHEGRCCKISSKEEYEDTIDYIVYEDEIKPGTPYIISLNDQSLYNKPKYEDHGGATLEEILVPVILAVPHNEKSRINYKVMDEKLEVSGLDKVVSFMILPDPEVEAYVVEADGTQHVLKKSNINYSATLLSGREQELTVKVEEREYKFRTKSKAKKNMEGDDGFDD